MRHRLAVLIIILALMVPLTLPSAAHTAPHSHTCTSAGHGYQIEGAWRHNAVVHMIPVQGGFDRWVTSTHQQWQYPNTWVTQHTYSTSHCLVV